MTLFRCSCLLPLALLAACATTERVRVQRVDVPVAVSCAPDVPAPPTYAADVVPLDSSLFDLVRALLIDRDQRRMTEAELRAVLEACR